MIALWAQNALKPFQLGLYINGQLQYWSQYSVGTPTSAVSNWNQVVFPTFGGPGVKNSRPNSVAGNDLQANAPLIGPS